MIAFLVPVLSSIWAGHDFNCWLVPVRIFQKARSFILVNTSTLAKW